MVNLAPVGDGCLVASAVAAGLGIDDQPLRSAEHALIEELSSKELVVVLDNCEHLPGAVAALVAKLLDGCPSLRVVDLTVRGRLELERGNVAELAVEAVTVPPVDPAQRGEIELVDGAEPAVVADAPTLVEPDHALCHGVVERVADTADRSDGDGVVEAARVTPSQTAGSETDGGRVAARRPRNPQRRHQHSSW